jgi:hypothetical protein
MAAEDRGNMLDFLGLEGDITPGKIVFGVLVALALVLFIVVIAGS